MESTRQDNEKDKKDENELTYFDFKGEIIGNPLPVIHEANQGVILSQRFKRQTNEVYEQDLPRNKRDELLQKILNDYEQAISTLPARGTFPEDYLVIYPYQTAVAESWNERKSQEDRFLVRKLDERYQTLTAKELETCSHKTLATLQQIVGNIPFESLTGSTVSALFSMGNQLVQTNLGDSVAFVYEVNTTNGAYSFKQLNEAHLHRPDVAREAERLAKEGANVTKGKLIYQGNDLAVSRAIGDTKFKGISHEPESSIDEVNPSPDKKIILVNACDGLTEALTNENIADIITKHAQESPENIAKILIEAAKDAGTKDNISVIVSIHDPKQQFYSVIFDGHGTDEVADIAADIYPSILENQLLLNLLEKKDQVAAAHLSKDLSSALNGKSLDQVKTLYADINNGLKVQLSQSKINIDLMIKDLKLQTLITNKETADLAASIYPSILENQSLLNSLAKIDQDAATQLSKNLLSALDGKTLDQVKTLYAIINTGIKDQLSQPKINIDALIQYLNLQALVTNKEDADRAADIYSRILENQALLNSLAKIDQNAATQLTDNLYSALEGKTLDQIKTLYAIVNTGINDQLSQPKINIELITEYLKLQTLITNESDLILKRIDDSTDIPNVYKQTIAKALQANLTTLLKTVEANLSTHIKNQDIQAPQSIKEIRTSIQNMAIEFEVLKNSLIEIHRLIEQVKTQGGVQNKLSEELTNLLNRNINHVGRFSTVEIIDNMRTGLANIQMRAIHASSSVNNFKKALGNFGFYKLDPQLNTQKMLEQCFANLNMNLNELKKIKPTATPSNRA